MPTERLSGGWSGGEGEITELVKCCGVRTKHVLGTLTAGTWNDWWRGGC